MTKEAAAERLGRVPPQHRSHRSALLALLNERTCIVEKIGAVKEEFSLPVYEPKREDQVFRNVIEHNNGPLPPDAVKRIFERVIDEMRTVQKLRIRK